MGFMRKPLLYAHMQVQVIHKNTFNITVHNAIIEYFNLLIIALCTVTLFNVQNIHYLGTLK